MDKGDGEMVPILLEKDLKADDPPPVSTRRRRRRVLSTCLRKFLDVYIPTGEMLGAGSFGSVQTYVHKNSHKEFAVKLVMKTAEKTRKKVLKEIEIFHHCQGHPNILQMIEYYEEDDRFYLIFEKMEGGTLLRTIERRGHLTEQEASLVIKDVANALFHLHKKGIAHRDLKPENILCAVANQLTPVKLCDFDLGSGIHINSKRTSPITTPVLQSPVGSAEFMAPEVVEVWQDMADSYDKRCDLWSLGIILYILLCGYAPFYANCGGNCGWENGGACNACQEILFDNIQVGVYNFPDRDWTSISMSAKDLISHLLVKNPAQRYNAEEVLQHPWITMDGEELPLATPDVLKKTNSVRELQVFTENANAVNRMIQQQLSISLTKSPDVILAELARDRPSRFEYEEDDYDDERLIGKRHSSSSLHNYDYNNDSDTDYGLVMLNTPRDAISIPERSNTRLGIDWSRWVGGDRGDVGGSIESPVHSNDPATPKFTPNWPFELGTSGNNNNNNNNNGNTAYRIDEDICEATKRLLSGGGESVGNDSGFCGGRYDVAKLLISDQSVNSWWKRNYRSRLSF